MDLDFKSCGYEPMNNIEKIFENYMSEVCKENQDPSHDLLHVKRVVQIAKKLAVQENANLEIVVPASYLHDCVYISKTDQRRPQASRISADRALELLKSWDYPNEFLPAIHHAISALS